MVFSLIGIFGICAQTSFHHRLPYHGLRPRVDDHYDLRAIPVSGGMYGKRAIQVPWSGGLYGKRETPFESFVDEMVKRYQGRRLIPISGGVYG